MDRDTTVVFRCDASSEIGGGHVYRCIALAEAFERVGWQIGFAVSRSTLSVVSALRRRSWHVEKELTIGKVSAVELTNAWPGGVGLAVVDSYPISASQEGTLRPWASRVLVIDDLADRHHDCDLLLDQTLARAPTDYSRLIPPHAQLLCGASYALLRSEFATFREASLARRRTVERVSRVIISLGATDVGGATFEAVSAVRNASTSVGIDAVVGAEASSLSRLTELATRDPHLKIHVDTTEMASLMARADLAVGAAGISAWERCCVGLPTVMLVLADNQKSVAAALAKADAAVTIDDSPDRQQRVTAALLRLLEDPGRRADMSAHAASITDGQGADRVVAAVEAFNAQGVR